MELNGTLHRISRQAGAKVTCRTDEVPWAVESLAGHYDVAPAEVVRMLNEGQTLRTSAAFYVIED